MYLVCPQNNYWPTINFETLQLKEQPNISEIQEINELSIFYDYINQLKFRRLSIKYIVNNIINIQS